MFVASACLIASSLAQSPVPCAVCDESRYYILWFGSDLNGWRRPTKTHCWATWVKATPGQPVESKTISWYPADLKVNYFRPFQKEIGRNLGLDETIRHVQGQGERVTLFGPCETDASRWELACRQAERLESGRVRYQGADIQIRRDAHTSHCLHALSDADPVLAGMRQNAIEIGTEATRKLFYQQIAAGAVVRPEVTHDWIIPALGLDRYNLLRGR